MEEPATAPNATQQDEAEMLSLSEKAIQKEVERLLQDELDTFLAGEATEAQEEAERATSQDEGEKGDVMEKEPREEAGLLSLEAHKRPKFLEVVKEEEEEEEETKQESDQLTLLGDEELAVVGEEQETKEESDRLTLLSEEELKVTGDEEGDRLTLLGDEGLKLMEDEEKTNEDSDRLTLQEEEEEPSEKLQAGPMNLSEAVQQIIKQKSNKTRSSRGSIGSLWVRHRQKIKEAAQKQRIAMLPPGYFTKLGKVLDLPAFQELKALEWGSRARKWDPNPRLARMFHTEMPDDLPKKLAEKRISSEKEEHLLRLSDIMGKELYGLPDRDILPKAEEPEDEEELSSISKTPESLTPKPTEISAEPKKEVAGAAAKSQDTQAKKLLCESFYSYPENQNCRCKASAQKHQGNSIRKPQPHFALQEIAGLASSVWTLGQRISHWRLAHHNGYQADVPGQDKIYKQRLLKHEREIKAAVPLPLQEVIEEEVLAILTDTLEDYQKHLGAEHPLTKQMEYQVIALQLKLQRKGVF